MNVYDLLTHVSEVLGQLWNFLTNLLFSSIELFGNTFQVIDIIGYIAGIGLITYITITIIKFFTE